MQAYIQSATPTCSGFCARSTATLDCCPAAFGSLASPLLFQLHLLLHCSSYTRLLLLAPAGGCGGGTYNWPPALVDDCAGGLGGALNEVSEKGSPTLKVGSACVLMGA